MSPRTFRKTQYVRTYALILFRSEYLCIRAYVCISFFPTIDRSCNFIYFFPVVLCVPLSTYLFALFCISQVVPRLARVLKSFDRSRVTDVASFWLPDRDYEGHRRRAGSHHTKSSRRARIGLCVSVGSVGSVSVCR